jgi:hypothetical protein
MREPSHDDATLALKLYDLRRERELRKARRMIGDLCMGTWEDVQRVMDYDHKHNAHFRQATSYWEMCASFVNRGIFHPAIFVDTCGEGLFTYAGFLPFIARIREQSPRFLMQTEKAVSENPLLKERVDVIEKMMAGWRIEAEQARAAEQAKSRRKGKKGGKKKSKGR